MTHRKCFSELCMGGKIALVIRERGTMFERTECQPLLVVGFTVTPENKITASVKEGCAKEENGGPLII